MIHLAKFIHTDLGRTIMSMILGFGLATFFRMTCKDKDCLILKAPQIEEIDDKIFRHNNQCYKYTYMTNKCKDRSKIIHME